LRKFGGLGVFGLYSFCFIVVAFLILPTTRQWSEVDYPELRHPASSIRVLHIQPGAGKGSVYGTLQSVALKQRPEFEALTYTWGDAKYSKSITVNGEKMKISKNLHDALVGIRHRSEVRTVWVDQICINQGSLEEKNSQIPLMTFIYGRAKTALLWLGNHKGPRWVEGADEWDWSGEWAVAHASRFPLAAKYWLYRLAEEEYWKRAWIIQEIGMASNIQVHFGRQSIPWRDFIELMEWYRREDTKANVNSILKLNALRQTMYLDRSSFSLWYLLTEFHDSFSTIPLDKIFGFVGMANECRNGCIDIDYSKSVYEAYEDVIMTLGMSSDAEPENRIPQMYVAAMIRQSLERKSALVPKTLKYFGKLADPNSYIYGACGDERAIVCSNDSSGNITHEAIVWDRLMSTLRWFGSFIVSQPPRHTTVWLPATTEPSDVWLPPEPTPAPDVGANLIQTRGVIAGSVAHIGPSYSAYIGDFKVVKWWTREVDFYPNLLDRRKARGLNDRFMNLLGTSSYTLLDHVKPIEAIDIDVADGPNLFFGSPVMVGLLPPNAMVGDLIVQFWNSNAAAVIRNGTDGRYQIIGRTLIVKDLYDFDWDTPGNWDLFQMNSSNTIDLAMNLTTLTRLSLDSVQLGHH
jgi:hypothetical protein